MTRLRFLICASALLAATALSGCRSSADPYEVYDPLESINRPIFQVNDALDRAIAKPLARGYVAIVPQPARTGVRNFLRNLSSPVNIANQLLQGDLQGAGNDVVRFSANTLVGLGGVIDVAGMHGIDYEPEDFGQTMGVWGIPNGPFLVVPILGPMTMRDGIGRAVDTYADPVRMYLYNTDREEIWYALGAVDLLDRRAQLLDVLDQLRASSLDYYAVVRSSHYQYREGLLNDRDPEELSAPAIPDYDE